MRASRRQTNMECRSFSHFGFHLNRSLMALDDFLDDRQTQPCAPALRRKKWSKYFGQMLLGDATSRIRDQNFNLIGMGLCTHTKRTSRYHGLASIFHQIYKDLADFILIQRYLPVPKGQILL